jgi:hypothetical protein
MDNLASVTYETFEQDPVKYALYEEAMIRAFASRPEGERLCAYICCSFLVLTFFVGWYASLVQAVAHLLHDVSRRSPELSGNEGRASSSSRKILMHT